MDRRALAQRNRKPQGKNDSPGADKPRHAVAVKNQNGHQNEKPRHNPFRTNPGESPKADVSSRPGSSSGLLNIQTGECVVCKNKAICVCQRCGDYYCSPECQRKDWSSHRYICFPVPSLVHPTKPLTNDQVYPVEKPLLSINQVANPPLESRQNVVNGAFNSNSMPNNIQQNIAFNGQQLQGLGQNIINRDANANQTVQKQLTATLPPAAIPKNNTRIILTGLRTPNRCYVRPLTTNEDEGYLLNARKIDAYGKTAATLTKMPKLHSYAVSIYEGVWYRVEVVLARNPDNLRVLFIDRGIVATRRLNQLREINDEIISLQQYACMLPLRNVSNYVLNGEMSKFFGTKEDLEFRIKYDRAEDGVELLYWQTDRSLNEEVEAFCRDSGAEVWADTVVKKKNNQPAAGNQKNNDKIDNKSKNAKPQNSPATNAAAAIGVDDEEADEQYYAKSTVSTTTKAAAKSVQKMADEQSTTTKAPEKSVEKVAVEEVQRPTMTPPFETSHFKVGCAPFKALVLDVSCLELGYVGCIAEADLPALQIVHKQLSALNVPNKPYVPKLDEYVLAKFEDEWYRAQVTDIPDKSHFLVTYIDFTNEATLTSADIRHYPASVTGACKTNLCLIGGLPSDFSAELVKFLEAEVPPQTILTIDGVSDIDEQVIIIECKSIMEKLKQKKLLA